MSDIEDCPGAFQSDFARILRTAALSGVHVVEVRHRVSIGNEVVETIVRLAPPREAGAAA